MRNKEVNGNMITMAQRSFDANDRDKWSKECGLEMEESVPGVAGRNIGGDTKREKRQREKKVGVECPGSIYNKAGVISTS